MGFYLQNISYEQFKHKVVQNLSGKITDQILDELKESYKYKIESTRRLSYIEKFDDLVALLEKRDAINENNVNIFIDIAERIQDRLLIDFIRAYQVERLYENHRNRSVDPSSIAVNRSESGTNSVHSKRELRTAKDYCFEKLAKSLGKDWISVARFLDMQEGDIDDILKLYKIPSQQTMEMLHRLEQPPGKLYIPRTVRSCLEKALRSSQRNDLVDEIAYIYDNF